ncbi:MAG: hypothetical protein AAGC60_14400 [Acidobacteriota bacterium]
MRRVFSIGSFLLLVTLAVAGSATASSTARSIVRLAPGDVWCPTGLTIGEGRPGLQSSSSGVFDRGDFESSFRAPGNGWVYVTLVATSTVTIDNIVTMPRAQYFSPSTRFFDSDSCHRDTDPTFPRLRVRAFDLEAPDGAPDLLPSGARLERFDVADLDALRERGWEIGNAVFNSAASAVERLPLGDQAAVTATCPGAGPTVCTGTGGSLLLPAGERVRFPVRVPAGEDMVLQFWWRAAEGARLDVRVDDYAACPEEPEGLFIEHASEIEVEIESATLKPGIDPEINLLFALIEDQSDTFGKVTIDGRLFDIPQIDGDDDPTWKGRARFAVGDLSDPSAVPIRIELFDNDEFDNAHVDLDMSPTDKDLDLVVDLCSMRVEGDLSTDMAGPIEARGDESSVDDQGLLRFTISSPSGRPVTTDDLAVVDLDFVQAVHGSRFAVTEKPGVVMVSVANNFETAIDTEVLVELFAPGFFVSRRFPVRLEAKARETFYFFQDTPIFPPSPTPGVETFLGINATIDPDDIFSSGLPSGDCRRDNDAVEEKFWKLVQTRDLTINYCKVSRLLETGEVDGLVGDALLQENRILGTDFIRAVFPTPAVSSRTCPAPMPVTPNLAVIEFIGSVFEGFDIPALSAFPFALVWDMNTFAALAGMDRVLGVLPDADWYEQFEGWETTIGNSLGEAAPHAAIFLPRVKDLDEVEQVKVTLPGHELAHTFGLSADPDLKDTASCGVTILGDPFGIGDLICGATGGLDEYSFADPARARGNPATGFWVELGTEDPRLAVHAGEPQCNRHCFMGRSLSNQLDDWAVNGRWIDLGDWEHLIGSLKEHPDPELIFLGGMIDPADNAYLGPWFRIPFGVPDRVDGDARGYRARFWDANDDLLQDVGFPVTFGASDSPSETPPITFFGFTVPWPADTVRITIERGGDDDGVPAATVATRLVSANVPTVEITAPPTGTLIPETGPLQLDWNASDDDGDSLSAVVMASLDGDTWSVIHGWTELETAPLAPELFPGTTVSLKVVVTDGVHSAESTPIEIDASRLLFTDDFESGDLGAWTANVP